MNATLVHALGEELAAVVGALAGASATVAPGATAVGGDGWTTTIDTDAAARGSWTLFVDAAGAKALTAAIMGLPDDVPPAAVADTLRETISQAMSALSLQDVASGVVLRAAAVEPSPAIAVHEPATTLTITCAGVATPLTITVCGEIDVTVLPPAPLKPAGSGADRPASLGDFPRAEAVGAGPDRLDAILDIELPLVVRFGRTELPLRALAHLGPGSLIDLGRSADDPVDLLVSNRVVARGEVVVVGGNYGVRVLDVVSPRDRARPMEA